MRFAVYVLNGHRGLAVDFGEGFRGLFQDEPGYPGDLDHLIAGQAALSAAASALQVGQPISVETVRLLPPFPNPGKIICIGLNNGALGFSELEQISTGFLDFGTELANPSFASMAEAVGIRGVRIESPDEVEASIAAALAHTGPVLIDAVVNRTELAMPPSITFEMARGFTLYMVRAIMNGRGEELIDLAATNLSR